MNIKHLNLNITIKTSDGEDTNYDVISRMLSDINNCYLSRDWVLVIDDEREIIMRL